MTDQGAIDAPTLLIERTQHRVRRGHGPTMRPSRQGPRRIVVAARIGGTGAILAALFTLALIPLASQAGSPTYSRASARSEVCQ